MTFFMDLAGILDCNFLTFWVVGVILLSWKTDSRMEEKSYGKEEI
jgi:hypothetical protein